MSTIVVVKKNRSIAIAADSLTTFGDTRQTAAMDAAYDKILRLQDGYMGIVGSAAHQLVMESALPGLEGAGFASRMEIFESFRRLHGVLKDTYHLNPKDEEGDPYESSHIDALIANRHGIFGVYALREVFEYQQYWAIGSGSEFALGCMHALYQRLDDPADIAKAAVTSAAEFNASTALPLSCYTIAMDSETKTIMV
ncbi:MAG: hypothetical protein ACWA44_04630 [Thiotrichales bacterium]